MQDVFTSAVKAGDQVRAAGRTETGRKGDTRFEVQSVTNTRTNVTAENPDSVRLASPLTNGQRRDTTTDREPRLQYLERQIEQLQREVERLRRAMK
jgi:TolA-binding protein